MSRVRVACVTLSPSNTKNSLRLLILIFCLFANTSVQGSVPWAWLNRELKTVERREHELRSALAALPAVHAPQSLEHAGFHSGMAPTANSVRWVQVDLGIEHELDAVVVVPANLSGAESYGFPLRFRVDASNDPLFADSVTLLNQTAADVSMPLLPWRVAAKGVKARHVRFTATKLAPQPRLTNSFIFCLGELLVFSGGRNVALRSEVLAPNSVETLPTWSPQHLVDGCYALGLPVRLDEVTSYGWHSRISKSADVTKWVQIDFGELRDLDEIRLIPARPRNYPDRFGFGFPHRFTIEADGRAIADSMQANIGSPGETAVAFRTPGLAAQTLRITASRLWERSGDYAFAMAELQAFGGGRNLARDARVTSSDDIFSNGWQHEFLVDGRSSSGVLLDEATWLAELSQRREVADELALVSFAHAAALITAQTRAAWMAGGVLMIIAAIVTVVIIRSRRSRYIEMESLRKRISRDLHDEIGSHLGSIRLMSELALREGSDSESLEEIHRLAGEAAESMRGIIWLVREGDAPKLNSLVEAMRHSAATLLKGIDWQLEATTGDDSTTAALDFHRQVFLLFREAAHNITRHAKATEVHIRVEWKPKRFRLCVEDNGIGFDADAVIAGDGLANLRHRADVLGGTLQITSEPGKGTRITLEAALS